MVSTIQLFALSIEMSENDFMSFAKWNNFYFKNNLCFSESQNDT